MAFPTANTRVKVAGAVAWLAGACTLFYCVRKMKE